MKVALAIATISGANAINIRSHFGQSLVKLNKDKAKNVNLKRRVIAGVRVPTVTQQEGEQPAFAETEGECKCPEGSFWAPFAGADGKGECLAQYGLGQECGMFQEDVRARACLSGSKCVPTSETQVDTNGAAPGGETIAADIDGNTESGTPLNGAYQTPDNTNDLSPNFGLPAKCVACTKEELDTGVCSHAKTCAKTATISGKLCMQVRVEHASCGDHTTGEDHHVEATAEATASATATATAETVGTIPVTCTHEGNTATVNAPGGSQDVTVTEEVTTEASGAATVNAGETAIVVNGKSAGFVEKCVSVEEAVAEIEQEINETMPSPLTIEQAHRLVDHMRMMATHEAKDAAVGAASDDACQQAQDAATKMAHEKAKKAATAAANDAADKAAGKAADAAADAAATTASGDSNATAQATLGPEAYQKAYDEACAMAKDATAGAQDLASSQGATTAGAVAQTDGAASAVASSAGGADGGDDVSVKQTAEDVAEGMP